jgi:hypothetical protein
MMMVGSAHPSFFFAILSGAKNLAFPVGEILRSAQDDKRTGV